MKAESQLFIKQKKYNNNNINFLYDELRKDTASLLSNYYFCWNSNNVVYLQYTVLVH